MPDWLFSEADKLKLKSQLHGEVEKKIDEVKGMLEKSMSGLDRRKLTEKMLLNRNTKMPELMGAMLVTLEK
ncbi:MAG TPA: hypothetical protein PK765_02860 [bacterium]|nr:hypothetical protein [bacterium]